MSRIANRKKLLDTVTGDYIVDEPTPVACDEETSPARLGRGELTDIAAVIAKFKSTSVSDDGSDVIVTFVAAAQDISIALPADDLDGMLMMLSQASGRARSIQSQDRSMKHVLPCEWWEFGKHPDEKHMILSFRMPGGAEASFQVHLGRAPQMIEALQSISGVPMSAPPGTTKQ